jgi:hypothetical protein
VKIATMIVVWRHSAADHRGVVCLADENAAAGHDDLPGADRFCYMVVEIVYIAKLELFPGKPQTSMALLLSIFLLTTPWAAAC